MKGPVDARPDVVSRSVGDINTAQVNRWRGQAPVQSSPLQASNQPSQRSAFSQCLGLETSLGGSGLLHNQSGRNWSGAWSSAPQYERTASIVD